MDGFAAYLIFSAATILATRQLLPERLTVEPESRHDVQLDHNRVGEAIYYDAPIWSVPTLRR